MKTITLCLSLLLLLFIDDTSAFLSWIFGGKSSQGNDGDEGAGSAVSAGRVPFEMKTADEKFLGTGKELMAGLSELDVCHHTVVYQLKATCNEMTEEELAKLGVRLLNCQSQAEGRPIYKCSDDMTVAECTSGMDPNTWNAYHIVSNRARSVCYAVRQQQFQRQTQFAVNQLAESAEGQLHMMENLRNGQDELSSMATDTLHTISEGQEKLVKTQEMLGVSQSRLKMTVESNIRDLTREKALIAAGHQELAEMTQNIRQQLDVATQELLDQDLHQSSKHQELMEDLSSLSLLAKDVWNKLDQNMDYMHAYQEETAQHYHQTLDNLKKMNDTIGYLLHVMHDMQTEISEQLGWVTQLLKFTGENMALLVTCTLHTFYFFFAAILSSFLQTPFFSRVVLLLVVPLNAAAEIRQGTSLNFPSLSFFIISVVTANWMLLWLTSLRFGRRAVEMDRRPRTLNLERRPRTLYLPDISHIPGSSMTDTTYDPSFLSEGSSDLDASSTGRRMHSTGYTSMLSDTVMSVSALFMGQSTGGDKKPRRMTEDKDKSEADSGTDASTDDDDDDDWTDHDVTATENQSSRTMTVTNLSSTVDDTRDATPEPTPMPNSQSFGDHMDFGSSINITAAKRHLGGALEGAQAATPHSPKQARAFKPTPSSSRSSSPSRRPCGGKTKAGLPCRLPCASGQDFCHRHIGTPQNSPSTTPTKVTIKTEY